MTSWLVCLAASVALSAAAQAKVACKSTPSSLCLAHPHNGVLTRTAAAGWMECCAKCAVSPPCKSWELRGKAQCILRTLPPESAAPEPGVACSSNARPPPPAPPPASPTAPLPFPPTNNGNPYGVWTKYGSVGDPTPVSQCPIQSGHLIKADWSEIEPADGVFNWTVLDGRIGNATSQGLHVSLMIWVALHGSPPAPAWLMSPAVGVPGVEVHGESGNHVRGSTSWIQPWYFSDVYVERHTRMIQALASHLRSLPPALFDMIRGFQPALGSTGDFTPWHGTPKDPKYSISDQQWVAYANDRTATFVSAFAGTGIPLIWNFGDAIENGTAAKSRLDYLFSKLPANNTFVKLGMVSHSYQLNGEADYNALWQPYLGAGVPRRSHGEAGDGSGCELEQVFWHYWNTCLWNIMFGLDSWNLGGDILTDQRHWLTLEMFSRHGGIRAAAAAPGAFVGFHDGLDASDTLRFPEAVFGQATQSNAARYHAIAAHFAVHGATIEDIHAAMGGAMASRKSSGMNDVGWRIYAGNYEKWMTQLSPGVGDVGMWRVNSTDPSQPFGRFARGFQKATGRGSMHFSVDSGIAAKALALELRVVYLDGPPASWTASYRMATGVTSSMTQCLAVTTAGTGIYMTAVAKLPGVAISPAMDSADLALEAGPGEHDAVFAFVEVARVSA